MSIQYDYYTMQYNILYKQLSGRQPINSDWSSYSNRTTTHTLSVDHENLFELDILLNYFGTGYTNNITTE